MKLKFKTLILDQKYKKVVQLANQLNDAMKKLDDALTGNDAIKQTSSILMKILLNKLTLMSIQIEVKT